ncbi:hypothetical protein GCM10009560_27470 [Nonomuraea longicatena]|uniref:Uncharacterized protein n=1 Tax=Nonomuraea longicatena TaxID=83682 RepID=A0ABP3ZSX4_9ACTN
MPGVLFEATAWSRIRCTSGFTEAMPSDVARADAGKEVATRVAVTRADKEVIMFVP